MQNYNNLGFHRYFQRLVDKQTNTTITLMRPKHREQKTKEFKYKGKLG